MRLGGTERVVDLGCGTGRDAAMVLERYPGAYVVGLDASSTMLAAAAGHLAPHAGRFELLEVDLNGGFLLTEPAEAVMSVAALHWVADHPSVFASVRRALVPGGRFAAECGGQGNIAAVSRALADVTGRRDAWEFADAKVTAARLRACGFREVHARLRPDPLRLAPETLRPFLATVVVGGHIADLGHDEAREFVSAVADRMAESIIDYVRLEFEATNP